jgi:hypothetical protein
LLKFCLGFGLALPAQIPEVNLKDLGSGHQLLQPGELFIRLFFKFYLAGALQFPLWVASRRGKLQCWRLWSEINSGKRHESAPQVAGLARLPNATQCSNFPELFF